MLLQVNDAYIRDSLAKISEADLCERTVSSSLLPPTPEETPNQPTTRIVLGLSCATDCQCAGAFPSAELSESAVQTLRERDGRLEPDPGCQRHAGVRSAAFSVPGLGRLHHHHMVLIPP